MKKYTISITEDQRHELIKLIGDKVNEAKYANSFMRSNMETVSEASQQEIRAEVSRFYDLWTNFYTHILLVNPDEQTTNN